MISPGRAGIRAGSGTIPECSGQAPRRAIGDAGAPPTTAALAARGHVSSRKPPSWLPRRRNTSVRQVNSTLLLSVLVDSRQSMRPGDNHATPKDHHRRHRPGAVTVRTAPATVAGRTETILVNAHGLPLYFYRPDTAARSLVTGSLAQLWPPLTSAAPTATGTSGKLAVLNDVNGHQVTYNGHPLYTFADDHAGQVTGQGIQNFFVATPGLTPLTTSSAGTVPAAPSGGGLGY